MGRIYNFLLGVVVGFGLYHAAYNYHVVQAADGFHLVAKVPPRFSEVYVDVRQFGINDWREHAQLAVALQKAGKGHVLGDSARGLLGEAVNRGLDAVLPPAPQR